MQTLLHHNLDRSAEKFNDKAAYRFNQEQISYSHLSLKSNQLANKLIDLGIKKSDRVGIFMSKTLELPIAIYGILKAGAIYVPIDPASPIERISLLIDTCQIAYLISNAKKKQIISIVSQTKTLKGVLGSNYISKKVGIISWDEIFSTSTLSTGVKIYDSDPAYIIFTSGSTGKPKGIVHTHYSGMNYVNFSALTYEINHQDIISNMSQLHFDMSTFDYLTAPFAGATTVIISEAYSKAVASLSALIERERMTVWYSVPHTLIQLLQHGVLDQRNLDSLRWVLFGGEPFPIKHLRKLMKLLPLAIFSNVYGPAEVNQCSYYHLETDVDKNSKSIPIGKIWHQCEGILLNKYDSIIKQTNQPGELVVHTPTMMKGYWDNDELNKHCFYYPNQENKCFYRTGDIASYDDDLNLILHGRKDRQIKLRGYRIDLDGIEAVFNSHKHIEQAAAILINIEDDKQLDFVNSWIEVIVKLNNKTIHPSTLIEFAKNLLPAYAMPQHIYTINQFPRTTSGKIDRKKLIEVALIRHKQNLTKVIT